MKKLWLLSGLTLGMFFSCQTLGTSSGSGNHSERADRIILRLDNNKDGKISKSEIKYPMTDNIFNENDSNGDGYLTKTEIIEYLNKKN